MYFEAAAKKKKKQKKHNCTRYSYNFWCFAVLLSLFRHHVTTSYFFCRTNTRKFSRSTFMPLFSLLFAMFAFQTIIYKTFQLFSNLCQSNIQRRKDAKLIWSAETQFSYTLNLSMRFRWKYVFCNIKTKSSKECRASHRSSIDLRLP